MGWRGTLRTINSISRQMAREAERNRKQAEKEQTALEAQIAVEDWSEHIRSLTSIHVSKRNSIDWKGILEIDPPRPPLKTNTQQKAIQKKIDAFKPKLIDIFRGGSHKRLEKLQNALRKAADKDTNGFEEQQRIYEEKLSDLEQDHSMAKRVLAGETQAIKEVIAESQELSKDARIGKELFFRIEDGIVHAIVTVHGEDVLPNFRRKQLASGRLSETKMPAGQFNEIYQDYVASVALRMAGDLFNILPNDQIFVTCLKEMLNTQTGYQENTPILSVQFVRPTFQGLNLQNVDPSDSLQNFNFNMKFKRTKGFSTVEPLRPLT